MDNEARIRSRFEYSFVSQSWTTNADLIQRFERQIMSCFTDSWWDLGKVSTHGIYDGKLASEALEQFSDTRWDTHEQLFDDMDRIRNEARRHFIAGEYVDAEKAMLHVVDMIDHIKVASDRLTVTKSTAFGNALIKRDILVCLDSARIFTAIAADHIERLPEQRISGSSRLPSEIQATCDVKKNYVPMAINLLVSALKLCQMIKVPSVIKTEVYLLQWEAYTLKGEMRRAELALQAAHIYAPVDSGLARLQADVEQLTIGKITSRIVARYALKHRRPDIAQVEFLPVEVFD